jgi:outer membrane protein OmpA-like peptidoglycan-associated protein
MDLSKKRSSRYVTGIYALFIMLFAFTLSLFYASRCQYSPRPAKQDTDISKLQDSSDNLQEITKKIDTNKAQPEKKREISNSDKKVSDKIIIAPLSKKDFLDEKEENIDDSKTPSDDAINPSANPVRSQPNPISGHQGNIIYFSAESTGLTDKALDKLRKIYLVLLKDPDEELLLEGYGDSNKTNRHNKNLSKLRANIVKGYFVKREISNSRLKVFWIGSENPAKVNAFQKDKNKTHQVEVKFKLKSRDELK